MRRAAHVSVLAIAHRAGNSLPALQTAIALDADVIEADIHRYAGRLEVRHRKTMGPVPLLWDKWELVPRLPQLQLHELLAAAGSQATLMLDIKGLGTASGVAVAALVHERSPAIPVLVCSRNWAALAAFSGLSWARPVLSARNRSELRRLLTWLHSGHRAYGVSLHRTLLSQGLVAELHERVDRVLTWPVNELTTLDTVLRYGVSGVTSDEADVLRAVIELRSAPR